MSSAINLGALIKDYAPVVTGFLTLVPTCFLAYLAYRQNEINQRSQKVEMALRYNDHYVKLRTNISSWATDTADALEVFMQCDNMINNQNYINDELTKKLMSLMPQLEINQLATLFQETKLIFSKDVNDLCSKVLNNVGKILKLMKIIKEDFLLYHNPLLDPPVYNTVNVKKQIDLFKCHLTSLNEIYKSAASIYTPHIKIISEIGN